MLESVREKRAKASARTMAKDLGPVGWCHIGVEAPTRLTAKEKQVYEVNQAEMLWSNKDDR